MIVLPSAPPRSMAWKAALGPTAFLRGDARGVPSEDGETADRDRREGRDRGDQPIAAQRPAHALPGAVAAGSDGVASEHRPQVGGEVASGPVALVRILGEAGEDHGVEVARNPTTAGAGPARRRLGDGLERRGQRAVDRIGKLAGQGLEQDDAERIDIAAHVDRLGIDLLTINGSKMYGPKGVGALYVRTGTNLSPLIYGGGQERGRRSGTENVAGIAGLAAAYNEAVGLRNPEGHRLAALRDELARRLSAAIPGMIINGHPTRRLPNNLNLTIPGAEGEALVLYLDNAGIMASTGSACSTGDLDPSHVLLAIGRSADEANSSLRFTLGRATTPEHIDYLVATLPQIIERVRIISS